jgi:hypothetical protein
MRALALLVAAVAAYAQRPAPSPIHFQCTEEELQASGESCPATEPCPVYLELASLEVVGPKVFITGNFHTEGFTLASILLASDDGGHTWTEPHPRIRVAGLDQIQFLDFETGWIAGQTLQGTPKDPFLLQTTDGGKTWRVQPIFEETHPGAIEQFWFDSRSSGSLVIDRVQASETGVRHELYESMTGGASWMLRQATASPIRLKRASPSGNADWRLRADASSKTQRVERQQSGKWVVVAAFPVRVGECKSVEAPVAEPAPADANAPEPAAQPRPAPPPARKKPTLRP